MQDKFENLFLVSDLTRCRSSHTDTGQIILVTGFMLLLEGCEQHPGESQDAGYDTDDEYWMQLLEDAENSGCDAILFQAVPGQLAVALTKIAARREIDWVENGFEHDVKIGIIISKPGPREAAKQSDYRADLDPLQPVIRLVKAVNPNVRVELDEEMPEYLAHFFVDPPMRFEFSHIEWI